MQRTRRRELICLHSYSWSLWFGFILTSACRRQRDKFVLIDWLYLEGEGSISWRVLHVTSSVDTTRTAVAADPTTTLAPVASVIFSTTASPNLRQVLQVGPQFSVRRVGMHVTKQRGYTHCCVAKNRAVYILVSYERISGIQKFKNSKFQKKKKITRGTYVRIVLVPGTSTWYSYKNRDPFSNADMLDTIRVCDVVGVVQRRSMYSWACIIPYVDMYDLHKAQYLVYVNTHSRTRDFATKEQFARHARQVEILHPQCKRVQSGVIRRTLKILAYTRYVRRPHRFSSKPGQACL